MSLLDALRKCPSFRPGLAYNLSNTLYLAPTRLSPAARTMRSCRGESFAAPKRAVAPVSVGRFSQPDTVTSFAPLPESRASQGTAANTGFEPLAAGAADPTGLELASLVHEFLTATGQEQKEVADVVFQGNGDPLAAANVVIEAVEDINSIRIVDRGDSSHRVAFRLKAPWALRQSDGGHVAIIGHL